LRVLRDGNFEVRNRLHDTPRYFRNFQWRLSQAGTARLGRAVTKVPGSDRWTKQFHQQKILECLIEIDEIDMIFKR